MTKQQQVLQAVSEAVGNLLLRDRLNDPELGVGDIDHAVARGEISVKEIVQHFERELGDKLDPMA